MVETIRSAFRDIDIVDEVCVFLNDVPLGCLNRGPNNALSGAQAFQVPESGWRWGITDLGLFDLDVEAFNVADTDRDSAIDGEDNCPADFNPRQRNVDKDLLWNV